MSGVATTSFFAIVLSRSSSALGLTCPDLGCWTAIFRNHVVLIAPVLVSYSRGIVKPCVLYLRASLGLGHHLLTELGHLASEITVVL